jgi:hypothetical protein
MKTVMTIVQQFYFAAAFVASVVVNHTKFNDDSILRLAMLILTL